MLYSPEHGAAGCPPDVAETAEAYCFQQLGSSEASAFERHFLQCRRCAGEVRDARHYVASLRAALAQLEDSLPRPRARAHHG